MVQAKKYIIKFGGAAISDKLARNFPLKLEEITAKYRNYFFQDNVKRLAKEFAEVYNKSDDWVFINGAGPFGHILVERGADPTTIHESVKFLNERVVEIFNSALTNEVVSVHPFETCFYDGRGGKFDITEMYAQLQDIIRDGNIPFVYGDIVKVKDEERHKILSGDNLLREIANLWLADKAYFVTDVDGIFTTKGELVNLELVRKVRISGNEYKIEAAHLRVDKTGGILNKLSDLRCPVIILNGLKPGYLKHALLGKEIGTLVYSE